MDQWMLEWMSNEKIENVWMDGWNCSLYFIYLQLNLQISVYINDVNDQSPVFSESSISTTLPEGVPYGTVVEIVTATDSDHNGDEDIKYTKTSGDPDSKYST